MKNSKDLKLDTLFNIHEFVLLELDDGKKVGLILNSISSIGGEGTYSFLITNYSSNKLRSLDDIITDTFLTIYAIEFNDLPEGQNTHLNRIMVREQFLKREKSRFTAIGKIYFSTDMIVAGGDASDWETIHSIFPYNEYRKKVEKSGTCKIIEIPFSNSISIKKATDLPDMFSSIKSPLRRIELRKHIKTINFSRNYEEEWNQEILEIRNISIDNGDALENLIDPDELVLTYNKYKILINYAVDEDVIINLEKANEKGTTRSELLKQIRKTYFDLLIHEFDSEEDFFFTFVLTDVGVYELENGEIILELGIDT